MLPVVVVVMRLRVITSPHVGFSASDGDIYTPVWKFVFGSISMGSALSIAIALVVTLLTCFVANGINNRYHFTPRQNNLCGFFFPILSGGFVIAHGLHPVGVFMLLIGLSMFRLLAAEQQVDRAGRACFESGAIFGIAYLLWAKTLWFVPFMLIMLAMLRLFYLRNFVGMIVGILTPSLLYMGYHFFIGDWRAPYDAYRYLSVVPVALYKTGWLARSYLIFCGLVLLVSVLSLLSRLHTFKIAESRQSRVVVWLVFYMALLIMTPYFSFELLVPLAFGGALLLSMWLPTLNYNLREALTAALVIFTIVVQWRL